MNKNIYIYTCEINKFSLVTQTMPARVVQHLHAEFFALKRIVSCFIIACFTVL